MKTFTVLHNENFKDCCFSGVKFPIKVKGAIVKSGAMKGWLEVKGSEFIDQGCDSWLTSEEMVFEFSPAAFTKG